jgi:hypothetical protein
MFLICCNEFRASSVSRWSLEKPCWSLVRGHSSTMCWMVSFSALCDLENGCMRNSSFQSGLRDFNINGGKFAMSCVIEQMFGEF